MWKCQQERGEKLLGKTAIYFAVAMAAVTILGVTTATAPGLASSTLLKALLEQPAMLNYVKSWRADIGEKIENIVQHRQRTLCYVAQLADASVLEALDWAAQ